MAKKKKLDLREVYEAYAKNIAKMRDWKEKAWLESEKRGDKKHYFEEVRGFGGERGNPLCSWLDGGHQCWEIEICLRFHGKKKPCLKLRVKKS